DKAPLLLQGQFYLNELTRRQQERHARRERRHERRLIYIELGLTIIITVMIAYEIFQGTRQATVMERMVESSLNQIKLMGSLLDKQQASLDTQQQSLNTITKMNDAVEAQVRETLAKPQLIPKLEL